jgi:ADP-L-glycero-D-manno-heptose 6-epimerase
MIVLTGGAGFIGSNLLWRLNRDKLNDILVVDNLGISEKWKNLTNRNIYLCLHKDDFFPWLEKNGKDHHIEAVVHLGACSSTSEKNMDYLLRNNVQYSIKLFQYCVAHRVPFIYASSAATYGNGEHGYEDSEKFIPNLRPINPYGLSKQMFDLWTLKQTAFPPFWVGLKFFNVFGPFEYHKGDMKSLVCKAVPQILENGKLKLFKSHKDGINHGEQKRDFVYVKDVVEVLMHFINAARLKHLSIESGIYNVGSGHARSFADLGHAIFKAMDKTAVFDWIDIPASIRDGYQYFTEADLSNLRTRGGVTFPFTPLEEAVDDYVKNYLIGGHLFS